MAGLMYFLPDLYTQHIVRGGELSHALLEKRGVAEVLADRLTTDLTSVFDLRIRGPGGYCGAMIVPLPNCGTAPPRLTYEPTMQDWSPGWDEKQLWIGVDQSARPTPADLVRRERTTGYDVELADGQLWHVPVIRRPGGSTNLPRTIRFGPEERMAMQIERRYEAIWNDMAPALELLCGEGGEVEVEPFVKLAIRVLGVNYRYGLQEQNVLQLVSSTSWQAILEAAIDWPLVETKIAELEKKRGPAAPSPAASTPPGPPADSPSTAPATQS